MVKLRLEWIKVKRGSFLYQKCTGRKSELGFLKVVFFFFFDYWSALDKFWWENCESLFIFWVICLECKDFMSYKTVSYSLCCLKKVFEYLRKLSFLNNKRAKFCLGLCNLFFFCLWNLLFSLWLNRYLSVASLSNLWSLLTQVSKTSLFF